MIHPRVDGNWESADVSVISAMAGRKCCRSAGEILPGEYGSSDGRGVDCSVITMAVGGLGCN